MLAFIFMYKKWPFPVPVSINTIVTSDRTVLSICKQ